MSKAVDKITERERLLCEILEIAESSGRENVGAWLAKIGQMCASGRLRIYGFAPDNSRMELFQEWVSEGTVELAEEWKVVELEGLKSVVDKMLSSEVVWVSSVAKMPKKFAKEKEVLMRQGVDQCIFLPLGRKGAVKGLVQLDKLENVAWWAVEGLGILKRVIDGLVEVLPSEDGDDGKKNIFEGVFNSVNKGMVVIDIDGEIEEINSSFERMFSVKKADLIGKDVAELEIIIGNRSIQAIKSVLGNDRQVVNIAPIEFEVSIGGKTVQLETSLMRLKNSGFLLLMDDITIRKQIESAVTTSEERLKKVLESVREGITLSNDKGAFLIFNSEMERLTGYSKEQADAITDFFGALHPDNSGKADLGKVLGSMKEGEKRTNQVKITTKSGLVRDVVVSTIVIDHGARMYLSTYHDITERKRNEDQMIARNLQLEKLTGELNKTASDLIQARDHLEEKVKEQTEQLRKTLVEVENLAKFSSEDPYPVMRISADGVLLYANSASKSLLTNWQIEVNQQVPKGWKKVVADVYEKNNRNLAEVELMGQVLSFAVVPIHSGGYVNLYGRDVTEIKEVEKSKNEFISMVSHQIRTPLTSIRWYSEMLLDSNPPLSKEQIETANVIHEVAVTLTDLVNDLLNISRMESGKLEYNPSMGDIVAMIERIISEITPLAQEARVSIELVKPVIEKFVFDPKLIEQVIMNLVSNAVKYSRKDSKIVVSAQANSGQFVFDVRDYGLGIPEAAQGNMFKRFYRAQNVVDAEIEGTGLGLSVAKMMVEKCGGKIWFESKEGEGSKFSFSIPMTLGS